MENRTAPLRKYDHDADEMFLRVIRRKFAAGAAASAVGLQVSSDNDQVAWACAGVVVFCIVVWVWLTVRSRRFRW